LAGTYGVSNAQFRVMLESRGLKPISALWDYALFAQSPEKVIEEAKNLGVKYVGTAWIPHDGALTEAQVHEAAKVFNRAGELSAREGFQFFYHNHGYEFVKNGTGTLFDLLVAETKPGDVSFEMDLFWTVHPGQDPVKLLQQHAGRWALMHVKDLRKGIATGKLTGNEDVRNDVALGSGQIELPAALREAVRVGVKHFFIEDESPISREQIPLSLRYLESLAW